MDTDATLWPPSAEALDDTTLCPACFSELTGVVCPECALRLDTPTAARLLEHVRSLLAVDRERHELIAEIRLENRQAEARRIAAARAAAAAAAAPSPAAPPPPPVCPLFGRSTPARRRARSAPRAKRGSGPTPRPSAAAAPSRSCCSRPGSSWCRSRPSSSP